jgi:hypothetical protein
MSFILVLVLKQQSSTKYPPEEGYIKGYKGKGTRGGAFKAFKRLCYHQLKL